MIQNPKIPPFEPPAAPQLRPTRTRHRRTGKVALLPQPTRDQINSLLDDGVPYQKLISSLGPDAAGLSIHNLSEWKHGGYQDYLDDKLWREEMREFLRRVSGLLETAG